MLAWDDLHIFLTVQRKGTHAAAGRALGVDATTIGRRLAALESVLGARLFQRTSAGLSPTGAGAALVPRAERIEAEILACERELHGADSRLEGTLRLTAGDGLMTYVLIPRLGEFQRAHPGVDLELYADNRPLDLTRREADVAVRLLRPREEALVARKLGPMAFALYGSEPYLARRKRPARARDLEEHAFIDYASMADRFPPAQWLRRTAPKARVVLRANTTAALVAACAAGHGLALLPTCIGAALPALVRLAISPAPPSRDVWAVFHQDLRASAKIKALLAWLEGALPR